MFFNINRVRHVSGMTLHFVNNGWCVSTDAGWTTFEAFNDGVRTLLIVKGYCDTMSLRDAALHADPRVLSGNFAVISITGERVTVLHDRNRGFPLWHYDEGNTISNMPPPKNAQPIHSDTTISATPTTVEISHFDPYYLEETPPQGDPDATIDYIAKLLEEKVAGLKAFNTAPIKSFVTGGLDSMLAYALTKDVGELVNHDHFERDRFWFKCGAEIKEAYWGYTQIHHWTEPTVLTSGAFGDEYFFRGPAAVALWAAWHDGKLRPAGGYLNSDTYHWDYFRRPKNQALFDDAYDRRVELQAKYPTVEDLNLQLLSMTLNDFQHWHLGNTLTWTPFKDIRILRAILAMDVESVVEHATNGDIEVDLIRRLDPDLLPALNQHKNRREGHNLDRLYR